MVYEKLIDYIRKGVQQGFNVAYIKDVLLKHGYKQAEIDTAMVAATASSQEEERTPRNFRNVMIGGVVIIALLFVIVLVNKGNNITWLTVEDIENKLTVQEYLDQIGELSEKIDRKELTIETHIKLIKDLEFDVEEKDKVIEEIDMLYKAIKKEREEVKGLLLELLDEVVDRFNKNLEAN